MDRYTAKKLTKKRRLSQVCHTFEIKVDKSHLSDVTKKHLANLFIEAKWYYNYCLSHKNIDDSDTKIKSVPVKISKKKEEEKYEDRKFKVLSSQMKQSIKTRLWNNLVSLSALKKKGFKVGWLKFKKQINSIPLKQNNVTFCIDFEKNKMRIQGLKPWIKVIGLNQITDNYEVANATLVKKANDYYFNITTFEMKPERNLEDDSIGIDFGCETQLTFSNGIKLEFQVPISKRLKRLDRKIMKKKRSHSKKKHQDQTNRLKEYNKIKNKKADIRKKVVSIVVNTYKYVCFQNESIHAWHSGNHGKKIQNSSIGIILSDLKSKSEVPIEIDKFFPSTQLCPVCGSKNKLSLSERIYECECGLKEDRDVKSAICIEREGMNLIPMEHRDFKAREILSSTFFNKLSKINNIKVSKIVSLS
jgi:putative transposase